jgi:hypothetical protein
MSIAPEEFLPYINGALDGMVQIVETLGDERINQPPSNLPNTNSPFVILTHCVGLTRSEERGQEKTRGHQSHDALLHKRAEEELNPQPTDP